MKRKLSFLAQFVKNPKGIGSILPTSNWVARRVVALLPKEAQTLVEYGPGTGAVTLPLLEALPNGASLYAIERNKTFVKKLKKLNLPRLHVIEGDAAEAIKSVPLPDVILSALPFRVFSEKERNRILEATAKMLPPHGIFIVYLQYTPFMEKHLKQHFSSVQRLFEWRNVPPTFIFVCKKTGPS